MISNFSQYQLLRTIDDVLDRVTIVRSGYPSFLDNSAVRQSYGGKNPLKLRIDTEQQYLYLHNPENSFESELVAWSTVVSDPIFFPTATGHPLARPLPSYLDIPNVVLDGVPLVPMPNRQAPVTWDSRRPLPRPRDGEVPYRVTYQLWHCLHGVRSLLLVLMDSCVSCAQDPDFVGNQTAYDSLWALRTMQGWIETDFVANAKYWKDWPLASFLRNPAPKKPVSWTHSPDDPIFAGKTGDYVRRLAHFNTNRPDSSSVYRAVFGLAQAKRGFARVPPSFIMGTMDKHSDQLSTPSSTVLGQDGFNPVLARRFAKTIFDSFRFPDTFADLTRMEASTSASVYTDRTSGGTRTSIRQEMANGFTTGASAPASGGHAGSRSSDPYITENPTFIRMIEATPGQVFEERGTLPLTSQEWRSLAKRWIEEAPTVSRLPRRYHEAFEKNHAAFMFQNRDRPDLPSPWAGLALSTRPTARVAVVVEPLKVRVITAMDPINAHLSRPLQGALWKHLLSFPQFQLVGESLSGEVLHDLNNRHHKTSLELNSDPVNDKFVSGDFSAATDTLDIRFSKLLLETLLEGVPDQDKVLKKIFRDTLLEQTIIYPNPGPEPIIQKNGQLMGSVLSFPFLCLANLYAYIASLADGDFGRAYSLMSDLRLIRRLPVLINGDDILFRCSPRRYQSWLLEISKVGFRPSVGKNFIHKKFFTMNSLPLEFSPRPRNNREYTNNRSWPDLFEFELANPGFPSDMPSTVTDTFTVHGFLNVGLLTGQSKLTGREGLKDLPISGWHAQSVLSAINPAQAHNWFIHYNLADIRRQTMFGGTTLNLFAHPLLGGLGFSIPPGVEPRFSDPQRRIARALFLSAVSTYGGQESEYSLPSLVTVSTASLAVRPLGYKRRRVEVELYPFGTPLAPGREPFEDTTQISRTPLSAPYMVLADIDVPSKVECRLTGRQLRSLSGRWGKYSVDLHPVDSMTTFPFVPVRTDSSVEGFSIYSPNIPFVDIPTTSDIFEDELPFASNPDAMEIIPSIRPLVRAPALQENDSLGEVASWESTSVHLALTTAVSASYLSEIVDLPGPLPRIQRSSEGRRRFRVYKRSNLSNVFYTG